MSHATAPPATMVDLCRIPKAQASLDQVGSAIERMEFSRGELRAVYLLDNRRIRENDGTVAGAAFVLDPQARVRIGAPLGRSLFGHVLVSRISQDGRGGTAPTIDEASIRAKFSTLSDAITCCSNAPYRLGEQIRTSAARTSAQDALPWVEEIGENGFVSICKEENERSLPVYYLVVRTDAGRAGHDLLDQYVKPREGSLTYAELLDSTEFQRVRLYSKRNAKRILSQVASYLGVRILRSDDVWAAVDRDAFDAPPDLAEPNLDTEYNTLERVRVRGFHGESIVYYSSATHLTSNQGGAVAFLVDPIFGLVLYRGDPNRHQASAGAWSNEFASAFPIGTGRQTDPQVVEAGRRRFATNRSARDFAGLILNWKGRVPNSPTHERAYIYSDLTPERTAVHEKDLGAAHGSVRLKPVAVFLPARPPSQ